MSRAFRSAQPSPFSASEAQTPKLSQALAREPQLPSGRGHAHRPELAARLALRLRYRPGAVQVHVAEHLPVLSKGGGGAEVLRLRHGLRGKREQLCQLLRAQFIPSRELGRERCEDIARKPAAAENLPRGYVLPEVRDVPGVQSEALPEAALPTEQRGDAEGRRYGVEPPSRS